VVGTQLSRTGDLAPANARLARAGVRLVKRSHVVGVSAGEVLVEDRYTGEKHQLAASILIESAYRVPAPPFVFGSSNAREHVVTAGDAIAPRSAYEAILVARRAVGTLEEIA
jgi:2,4-dienoyl-CoA reductase (NADPH2)